MVSLLYSGLVLASIVLVSAIALLEWRTLDARVCPGTASQIQLAKQLMKYRVEISSVAEAEADSGLLWMSQVT